MGTVYLAGRADDQFKKRVALKVLRAGIDAQEILRRFRHERQILATLNHPNIATLLDGGSTPSGEPYFVMDYIEGTPLDRYCDSHTLSIPERLSLFRVVCSAVQYVHQNLIVHRDLKPSNILVTPGGIPKLLDFGIAKILKPELLMTLGDATSPDMRVMSPPYASPEQIRGEPITTASDVYSLGVILYELLTGQRPYRPKSSSPHELSRAICEDQPEKPSTAISTADKSSQPQAATLEELSRKRSSLPEKLQRLFKGDLDNILLMALRKEPQRRYASVEQFSEDVRRHLESLPVVAHQDSVHYRTGKFVRRHQAPVIAAAIAVVALLAGMVTTLIEARAARAERTLAESRFQDVRKLATTFLFDVHDSIENLAGSTPARSLIARTGTEYLDRLMSESHGDPSLQQEVANGYLKIGDVEGDPYGANLGHPVKAIESYRKALAIASSLSSKNPSDVKSKQILARTHLQLAGVLPSHGKAAEGLEHSSAALRLYEQLLVLQPQSVEAKLAISHASETQGEILGGGPAMNLGRTQEALAFYERALNILPNPPPTDVLAGRVVRAKTILMIKIADHQARSRDIRALGQYKQALQIAEDLARADPHNQNASDLISVLLNRLADMEQDFGDTKAAIESYRRATEIDEAALKADPNNEKARNNTMVTQVNLGMFYFNRMKEMPQALKCFRRAAELLEMECQADPDNISAHQRLSETLTWISSTLFAMGQKEEARRQTQRGLALAKQLADRPDATRDQEYNYAWLAVTVDPADLRNPASALPYALKAARGGTDESSLHVLAQAYAGIGDYAHALESEEKALALFPPTSAGSPKSAQQKIFEGSLKEIRDHLKNRRDVK